MESGVRGGLTNAANGFAAWIFNNKLKVILIVLAALILLNFTKTAITVFFVVFLILLGSLSTIYKFKIKISFGFELVTLATVLSTVAYGPLIGFFVGFISALAAELIPQMIEAS